MMRLVDQDQLEPRRVILENSLPGCNALHTRYGDISRAGGVLVRHLDIHAFVRVQLSDMPSRLLHELATMRENESLCGEWCWIGHAIDEVAEDDGFATARC